MSNTYNATITTITGEAGPINATNLTDDDQNPTGGSVTALGVSIDWQHGPRGTEDGTLAPATGAFVEDLVLIARNRLEFFQDSKFRCRENALAITKLEEALHWMQHRRTDRAARGVEGKHEA